METERKIIPRLYGLGQSHEGNQQSFLAAPMAAICKAMLLFSPVLQISRSWECGREGMHNMLLGSNVSCQLDCRVQEGRLFQRAISMTWDTQTPKSQNEEQRRGRVIKNHPFFTGTGKALILNSLKAHHLHWVSSRYK